MRRLRAALAGETGAALRTGFELSAIDTQGGDGVVARGTDGSEANGACLIGADGLWSALRARISPGANLRFAGATAWRTQIPRATLPARFAEPVVGLWIGPRAHLVHYPVGGGADLNVVAVTMGGSGRQGWSQPGDAASLARELCALDQGGEIPARARGRLARLVALPPYRP